MLRSARRGFTALAVVALAVSLTACGAGRSAQTNQLYMPATGRNVDLPSPVVYRQPWLAIRNTVLVSSVKDPAVSSLVVTFVNNDVDDDALTSVSVNGVAQAVPGGSIPLPRKQDVTVGSPQSRYFITVKGLDATPGDWVEVTMTFQNAARATFNVLMVPQVNDYAQVPVLPKSLDRSASCVAGLTGCPALSASGG